MEMDCSRIILLLPVSRQWLLCRWFACRPGVAGTFRIAPANTERWRYP